MRYDASGRDRITPDPVLTQISIAFETETSTIAQELFPTIRVSSQAGRYPVYGRDAFSRHFGGTKRAPGARANEVEGRKRYFEDQYFATEDALEELTPTEEIENAPQGTNPEADAVEALTWDLLLGKELEVRDLVYDETAYLPAHVVTLGAGEKFNEYATSDPVQVFRDLFVDFHDTVGLIPNLAVIPWKVMRYLEDHPVIIERYAPLGGIVTPEQIATILGVQRILVPGGNYNAENPGQQAALSAIWGDQNIVLGIVPGSPALETPALGYEFLWPIPGGGRTTEDSVQADRRWDGDRIGWINRVRRRADRKFVGRDPDLPGAPVVGGALIRNVLAI
jgi:hypothetical protein